MCVSVSLDHHTCIASLDVEWWENLEGATRRTRITLGTGVFRQLGVVGNT